jgi:6-phosphofructokinase 2
MSILTLTLNPSVDTSAVVPSVVPQHKLRCHDLRRDAGGGGINVARVLRRYGAEVMALFTAGGPMGQLLEREVAAEAVPYVTVAIAGDTREDFTANDASDGAQYRFVLPGPELSAAEFESFVAATRRESARASIVVASGSLPPGVPDGAYRRLRAAVPDKAFFALDTSGAALEAALGGGIDLIKPSRRELAELTQSPLEDRQTCIAAARKLIAEGRTKSVALTLGEEGALYIGPDFALDARAPGVKVVSTVGAGDSFMAALVCSIAQKLPPAEVLRRAVAAGSAALLAHGTDLAHPKDAERLGRDIAVANLD